MQSNLVTTRCSNLEIPFVTTNVSEAPWWTTAWSKTVTTFTQNTCIKEEHQLSEEVHCTLATLGTPIRTQIIYDEANMNWVE